MLHALLSTAEAVLRRLTSTVPLLHNLASPLRKLLFRVERALEGPRGSSCTHAHAAGGGAGVLTQSTGDSSHAPRRSCVCSQQA